MLNLTPFLKLYAKRRYRYLENADPLALQEEQLFKLLKTGASTKIGEEYNFASITSVSEYQRRVPLRTYEQFWDEYWKEKFPIFQGMTWPSPSRYIPVSSGTTSGATKWIPYSDEMVRSNSKAGLDLLVYHCMNRPNSQIFGGKSFIIGGSTDLVERAPGIYSGDLSGIAIKTMPWWAKNRTFPDVNLALMKKWEEKIEVLSQRALEQDIRSISGVPSWMLLIFDKLKQLRPESEGKLSKLFPNLEMIIHGGVSFEPYLERYKKLLEGSQAELREVYPASEGFIAVADRGYKDGLRLNIDHSLFFEFVPLEEVNSPNPTRHWIKNIQPDINYAVIITSCAGVWSYIIGDTVKFVDTRTPRLLITGRTSYFMSAFGEHLIAEEVENGVIEAAHQCNFTVSDYSLGAYYPSKENELGKHIYVIEFIEDTITQQQLQRFTAILDATLSKLNEDYQAHRSNGVGMDTPEIRVVKPGFFAAWMKSRGKLGGQNKVPRIINNKELFQNLLSFKYEVNQ
jgi:phenylacetate-coenzyme A ligase PaaK-like adenylate-forming protein